MADDSKNSGKYLIKEVKTVPGNSLNSRWKREMQKIYTDNQSEGTDFFIDNNSFSGGHDWTKEIGKTVEAQINDSTGYKWISYTADKNNQQSEIIVQTKEEVLPAGYNIHENPELEKLYSYIKQNVPVMFLTGGAGTGKSTFIKYLKNNLKSDMSKNYVVLAPTGVAAINAGGQTIHSFFGFKTDLFEDKDIKKLSKNRILEHTDIIIIDEISMVPSWMLDHIDYALRLWCDSTKTFGGKQMLLIGDCFQLPPIAEKNDEVKQRYYERWENTFFFAAKVFETVELKAVQLKKIYRQKDDESFMHMLNRIRKCQAGYKNDINFLNQNCFLENRLGTTNIPDECLVLSTKNQDVDDFNNQKLNALKRKGAETHRFEGQITGKFDFKHFLTPETLELCVGARVMVTKNIASQNLANGDMGKVIAFGTDYIDVSIKGEKKHINREKWQSLKYSWNEQTNCIQQTEEGSFTQFPLKLGWAVTVHKSQGLTLESAAIDVSDAWASGQVYVALSRVKSLNGILLKKQIPDRAVKSDEYINEKYKELFPESENEDLYNGKEYENIRFINSEFTVDKTEESTSVVICGFELALYPDKNEKIQDHVKKTMDLLLKNNLIPENEINRLVNDKDYCYRVFGINWNGNKFTLLVKERSLDSRRYWATNYNGYYICSQWYQNLTEKFANWLIYLAEETKNKSF